MKTEQKGSRANSCPVSVSGVGNSEVWVNNYVITPHSSLDLLVPDRSLAQGCVDEQGNLRTMPILPDLECRMGGGRLQYGSGMLRGCLQ
jgi:hypothetical protein